MFENAHIFPLVTLDEIFNYHNLQISQTER